MASADSISSPPRIEYDYSLTGVNASLAVVIFNERWGRD